MPAYVSNTEYIACMLNSKRTAGFAESSRRKMSAVFLKPSQQSAHTAGGEANTRICRAVIKVDSVAIRSNGVATRKDDIVDVPAHFVGFLWSKDPLIAALQAKLRRLQIKESQSQPVDGSGRRLAHSVVNH